MWADRIIPILFLFGVAFIVFMLSKLIALAGIFLAASITILLVAQSILAAIPFVLLTLLFFSLVGRLYLFEQRLSTYINEAHRIFNDQHNQSISTIDYIIVARNWSKKVSEDIRRHKGKAEMELFLAQPSTREYNRVIDDPTNQEKPRRSYAAKIIETQSYQLVLLQRRL